MLNDILSTIVAVAMIALCGFMVYAAWRSER